MGSTGAGELFCSVPFNTTQLVGNCSFSRAFICSPLPTPYSCAFRLYLTGISLIFFFLPCPTDPAEVTAQADDGMAPVEDQRRKECAHSRRVGKYIGQE